MRIYNTRYQAEKARIQNLERVVKVSGGYAVMSYEEYRIWKKQK